MKTNNLEKYYLSFEEIWEKPHITKIFNTIPDSTKCATHEQYLEFIDLWDESRKYSGFFEREYFDVQDIKNICYVKYQENTKKIIASYDGVPIEFNNIKKLWEYFDDKKQTIIFYCHDFDQLSGKIKAFLKDEYFINNNKKHLNNNQWKYLKYKNKISAFLLKRTKLEDKVTHEWQIFFLPIEDEKIVKPITKNDHDIRNKDLYHLTMDLLIKFIFAIYSRKKENTDWFINYIVKTIDVSKNRKIRKELKRKIDCLFKNRSENKCLKALVWIAILIQNEKKKTMEAWALKNNFKVHKRTINLWLEKIIEPETSPLIEPLKVVKKKTISFLKQEGFRHVHLNPQFVCDFKKISIKEEAYAILDHVLLYVTYDEWWKYDKKYLWNLIGIYILNEVKGDRDLKTYKINKIRIFNPLYMLWIEVSVAELNEFYQTNFGIEIVDIKQSLRRVLNGE
ncbi:MAG: hypothetical protein ACRCVI_03325 [Mycoplasmoidaceae bacterium]